LTGKLGLLCYTRVKARY